MKATKIEKNFVIDGMPEEENETSEQTKEIVRQAAHKLQLNLESESVFSASRLGKRKLTTEARVIDQEGFWFAPSARRRRTGSWLRKPVYKKVFQVST